MAISLLTLCTGAADFLPFFGKLKMETDIYWAAMSAIMLSRMFKTLHGDGSISATMAVAHVAAVWITSAALVHLTLSYPHLYLKLRTRLLLAMRFHRTVIMLAFVSLPEVQVIKWSRLLPEASFWQYLVPAAFDCVTIVAICGFQCPGLWNVIAGSSLTLAAIVRLLRRCRPLATAAANARRDFVLQQVAGVAEQAAGALLPLTLTHRVPAPALMPCTQTNLALVLTMGSMFPMLLCYAAEGQCRLDFAAKRGLWVVAPSQVVMLVHAAALLAISGVIFWTVLSAIAPWAMEFFDLH